MKMIFVDEYFCNHKVIYTFKSEQIYQKQWAGAKINFDIKQIVKFIKR